MANFGKCLARWSVGILLFEMLVGMPPFRAKNQQALKKQITTGKIKFPSENGLTETFGMAFATFSETVAELFQAAAVSFLAGLALQHLRSGMLANRAPSGGFGCVGMAYARVRLGFGPQLCCPATVLFAAYLSTQSLSILKGFLIREPKNRLGYGSHGGQDVMKHPFFKTINWDKLYRREIPSPFRPIVKSSHSVGE